ncbi:DUF1803 domain-containing protein [Lactococcus insecticola]|uniref:DUF1803 domain-containing protein n=1 Tax=Pseudolactococcus insecticola TaxID=2709158 RepID=A0A6A0B916_9LACT|nr:DUF1803 domain-containing protein [Lactococcus insecticola]GFH40958.1 hypothetical protein Hs20B_13560 [Lactococcus insecticola]
MAQIKIFNQTKLTERPFFQDLIDHLDTHEDVTLRKLKVVFSDVKNLERQIEDFVQAGFIRRAEKRYTNAFQTFEDGDFDLTLPALEPKRLVYDAPFFVRNGSKLMTKLATSQVQQVLKNDTNGIKLHISSDFQRSDDSLANYFYHVDKRVKLTPLEEEVFELIGDSDPNYVLKYMTTFLLKFAKKDTVKNKKPDIFVRTLLKYGYIREVAPDLFATTFALADKKIATQKLDTAQDFIAQQIRQTKKVENFLTFE